MIAQRSCFTIHGRSLEPMVDILVGNKQTLSDYLIEYHINDNEGKRLLKELSLLGVSAATIFPDLDHLTIDLKFEIDAFKLD